MHQERRVSNQHTPNPGIAAAWRLLLLRDGVPQVRDQRRVNRLHDLERNFAPVDPVEQPHPRAVGDGYVRSMLKLLWIAERWLAIARIR